MKKYKESYKPYRNSLETSCFSTLIIWLIVVVGSVWVTYRAIPSIGNWDIFVLGIITNISKLIFAIFIVTVLEQIVVNLGAIAKELYVSNEIKVNTQDSKQ